MINNKVGLLDTTVSTLNVGDRIIYDSCFSQINELFIKEQFFNISTRDYLSPFSMKVLNGMDLSFLMGTNVLSSDNLLQGPWKLTPLHIPFIKNNNIVTLGVGWNSYQKEPSYYARYFYSKLLSNEMYHSVRDNYTAQMLIKSGVKNVLNTSCSTMWNLTEEHCKSIDCNKKDSVIFTLTDYSKDYEKDGFLIKLLIKEYKNVYFWAQGSEDINYLNCFDEGKTKEIKIIPPRLESFDHVLNSVDVDFVGTRLHAGIRALQKKRRAIIIGIDNRAIEKGKDFNLNVINKDDIYTSLKNEIFATKIVDVRIPQEKINLWKEQFK
ncbi:polysaccharide pyruvyl transferase family protein [Vibrio ordalii]|uniref:Polysaccharide pyruvyl transferase domain-containing protein n=1 Tax=Vibrio ordalii FS-238 TaxID=617133 RepID=A0A853R835_9VIBR|nr:polysaccharide pyruvyl transferase family protein [Vibrio ordalii]OEE41047.1 hypothetical protein A1QS_02415 [Vibrio ordalii FS-238]